MDSTDGPKRTGRFHGAAILGILLGCLAVSVAGRRLPPARAPDAAPAEFAASRARVLLDEIAQKPHPAGSPENDRVRQVLTERLEALGFEVEVQRGSVGEVALENVIVAIPGEAPTGTVLCAAHYDSVRRGPGAGDDGAGVVTWIEVLRALRSVAWRPRNDVLLLLTDGEEMGLLGAKLFASEDRRIGSIRTVVNLEAIGNGGPALLFQLGPRDGARVATFERVVSRPAGTSLAAAIFQRMPNDTDLSVFLRRGIPGFNLALTWGSTAYHAVHDTPANLDPRSLQHLGDCALALVLDLGQADLGAMDASDATFFDLLGVAVVRHPASWDVVFVVVAALLTILVVRRSWPGTRELAVAILCHAPWVLAAVVVVGGTWWAIDGLVGLVTAPLGWVAGNTTSGALLFAALVLGVCGITLVRPASEREAGLRRAAAMVVWTLLGAAGLAPLPGGSFVLYWPVILVGLGALTRGAVAGPVARVAAFAATLILALPILHTLTQLAQRVPLVAVAFASATAASLAELLVVELVRLPGGIRRARLGLMTMSLALMIASVVVARVLAWRSGALWP